MPVMNFSEIDPRHLSFSQAQGYAELPRPLNLGELSNAARNLLWSVLYSHVEKSKRHVSWMVGPGPHPPYVDKPWGEIFSHLHVNLHHSPLDEFSKEFHPLVDKYKSAFMQPGKPLNEVFDVLQEMMRHPLCTQEFIQDVSKALKTGQLAYIVNKTAPITILPAATPEEGRTLANALDGLDEAGLAGAATHLRSASGCITKADWPGAVRESIHAVESVARRFEPSAKTLGPALAKLEKKSPLHPAMKSAFSKLYGYTSDEQGIRHSLLDKPEADVGQDEAVFMLGACAAFSSYLVRKHEALGP